MRKVMNFLGLCAYVIVFGLFSILFFVAAFFFGVDIFKAVTDIVEYQQYQPLSFEYIKRHSEDIILPSMIMLIAILGGSFTSWLAFLPFCNCGGKKDQESNKT